MKPKRHTTGFVVGPGRKVLPETVGENYLHWRELLPKGHPNFELQSVEVSVEELAIDHVDASLILKLRAAEKNALRDYVRRVARVAAAIEENEGNFWWDGSAHRRHYLTERAQLPGGSETFETPGQTDLQYDASAPTRETLL